MLVFQGLSEHFIHRVFGVFGWRRVYLLFFNYYLKLFPSVWTLPWYKDAFQPLQGEDREKGRQEDNSSLTGMAKLRLEAQVMLYLSTWHSWKTQAFVPASPPAELLLALYHLAIWLQLHYIKKEIPIHLKPVTCDCRGRPAST